MYNIATRKFPIFCQRACIIAGKGLCVLYDNNVFMEIICQGRSAISPSPCQPIATAFSPRIFWFFFVCFFLVFRLGNPVSIRLRRRWYDIRRFSLCLVVVIYPQKRRKCVWSRRTSASFDFHWENEKPCAVNVYTT